MTNDETNSRLLSEAAEEAFWANGANEPLAMRETPPGAPKVYDLEERTALFGEAIVRFALTIPQGPVTNRLIDQLVGAGTSVGANYCEADDAYSRNEFRKNIGICKKEARETKFQLRMAVTAVPQLKPEARKLWQEAKELHLIFAAILRRTPRDERGRPERRANNAGNQGHLLARLQAELAGLRTIFERMPDDPLAKPLMASRVESLQAEVDQMQKELKVGSGTTSE